MGFQGTGLWHPMLSPFPCGTAGSAARKGVLKSLSAALQEWWLLPQVEFEAIWYQF